MDKVLISWTFPNLITIWLMVFLGFLALTVATQFLAKRKSNAAEEAGY